MINRLLDNNNSARFIAIMLALLIWIVAFSEEQSIMTSQGYTNDNKSFASVPIRFVGQNPEMNYIYSTDVIESVTLAGPLVWITDASIEDVSIFVDISHITEEGEHQVEVSVEVIRNLRVQSYYPQFVTVFMEAIIEEEFPVEVEYSGTLASGFYLQNYPLIEPSVVSAKGLRSDIAAISKAVALVDLLDRASSIATSSPLSLRGPVGETLHSHNYTLSSETVQVYQEVVTRVVLEVYAGDIALPAGFFTVSTEVIPSSLSVYVRVEELSTFNFLEFPTMDLTEGNPTVLAAVGIDAEDELYKMLLGEEEALPDIGKEWQRDLIYTLMLPDGIRWTNSEPGTFAEFAVRWHVIWLGDMYDSYDDYLAAETDSEDSLIQSPEYDDEEAAEISSEEEDDEGLFGY